MSKNSNKYLIIILIIIVSVCIIFVINDKKEKFSTIIDPPITVDSRTNILINPHFQYWLIFKSNDKMIFTSISNNTVGHYGFWADNTTLFEIIPDITGLNYKLKNKGKFIYFNGDNIESSETYNSNKSWEIVKNHASEYWLINNNKMLTMNGNNFEGSPYSNDRSKTWKIEQGPALCTTLPSVVSATENLPRTGFKQTVIGNCTGNDIPIVIGPNFGVAPKIIMLSGELSDISGIKTDDSGKWIRKAHNYPNHIGDEFKLEIVTSGNCKFLIATRRLSTGKSGGWGVRLEVCGVMSSSPTTTPTPTLSRSEFKQSIIGDKSAGDINILVGTNPSRPVVPKEFALTGNYSNVIGIRTNNDGKWLRKANNIASNIGDEFKMEIIGTGANKKLIVTRRTTSGTNEGKMDGWGLNLEVYGIIATTQAPTTTLAPTTTPAPTPAWTRENEVTTTQPTTTHRILYTVPSATLYIDNMSSNVATNTQPVSTPYNSVSLTDTLDLNNLFGLNPS